MFNPSKLYVDAEGVETPRTFTPDLRGLIAWLETKPSDGTYCWIGGGACLLQQFVAALGHPASGYTNGLRGLPLSGGGSFEEIAYESPHTYGAALQRARAAL